MATASNIVDILYFWSAHSPVSMSLANDIRNFQYPIKKICVDTKDVRQYLKDNKKVRVVVVPTMCLVTSDDKIGKLEGPQNIIDWLSKSGIKFVPVSEGRESPDNPQEEKPSKSSKTHQEKKSSKKGKKVSFKEKESIPDKSSKNRKGKKDKKKPQKVESSSSEDEDVQIIDFGENRDDQPGPKQFSSEPQYAKPDKKRELMTNIFAVAQQMAQQSKDTYGYDEEELPKF